MADPTANRVSIETRHGTVSGRADAVMLFAKICQDHEEAERQWIADLRSIGIKAAHPDDGWVDRKRAKRHDFVRFAYPQFNDGVQEGDRIALGWPDRYRVRIVQKVLREGLIWKHDEYQVVK